MAFDNFECKNCGSSITLDNENSNILTCAHCYSTYKIQSNNGERDIELLNTLKKHDKSIDYLERLTAADKMFDFSKKIIVPLIEEIGKKESDYKRNQLENEKSKNVEPIELTLKYYNDWSVLRVLSSGYRLKYGDKIFKGYYELKSKTPELLSSLEEELENYKKEKKKFMSTIFGKKKSGEAFDKAMRIISKLENNSGEMTDILKELARKFKQKHHDLQEWISLEVNTRRNVCWAFVEDESLSGFYQTLLEDEKDIYGCNYILTRDYALSCCQSDDEETELLCSLISDPEIDSKLPTIKDVQTAILKGAYQLGMDNLLDITIDNMRQLEYLSKIFEEFDIDYKLSKEMTV